MEFFRRGGGVGAFREDLIKIVGVAQKYLDRSSHCTDLVAPLHGTGGFSSARRNRQHRAAQIREAAYDVAPDVEPSNQACGDEGGDRERDEKDSTRADFLGGAGGNRLGALALLLAEAVDRLREVHGPG